MMSNPVMLALMISFTNYNFIVYVNDVPTYFYMSKRADSEQFIILNGKLHSGDNIIEIEPLDEAVTSEMLKGTNIQIGEISEGSFNGKILDNENFVATQKSRLLIGQFKGAREWGNLPWEDADLITDRNRKVIEDYLLYIRTLYANKEFDKLLEEMEYAIKLKQQAYPNRQEGSFKAFLEFEFDSIRERDDIIFVPFDEKADYQLVGNGKIAYTFNEKWEASLGAKKMVEPKYYIASLAVMVSLIGGKPVIVGYE